MDSEYKMVIVTRIDLSLSVGKIAVQVAHAAVSCALSTKKNNKRWFSHWQATGAKKAVVKVDCLEDFISLKAKSEKLKIATAMIEDAGLTEIPQGTITVLGIGPAPSNIIDQVTGSLPLL
ncbi:MAG: peptidyl-tRNA hydrolase Pth2 [Thermoplasmatota archaeon]